MILVCGEAIIDLFVDDAAHANMSSRITLGGSPMNVAIGLARLGEAVAFCGGLSSDRFGAALRRKLHSEGVSLDFIIDSDRLTTISVVTTDASGQPTYSFHGDGKADREITPAMLPATLPDEIRALTFGSYTLAVDPVADAYLSLARREAPRRVISVDPNVRLNVTPDLTDWKKRFGSFLPLADIVKASEEDLALAYGADVDIDDIVAGWFIAGPSIIVITHGGAGATGYLRSGEKISIPGKRINVVDTVGAGDTFHAAILSYLGQSGQLTKNGVMSLSASELGRAVDFAVAATAITCTRQGADLPRKSEIAATISG